MGRLVRIKIIVVDIPSGEIAANRKYIGFVGKEERYVEVVKRELDKLRNAFYRKLNKIAHNSYLGWVVLAPSDVVNDFVNEWNSRIREVLRELLEISESQGRHDVASKLRERIDKKFVRLVDIYVDRDTAVDLIRDILNSINSEASKIEKELNKSQPNSTRFRRLKSALNLLLEKEKVLESALRALEGTEGAKLENA